MHDLRETNVTGLDEEVNMAGRQDISIKEEAGNFLIFAEKLKVKQVIIGFWESAPGASLPWQMDKGFKVYLSMPNYLWLTPCR